MFAIAIPLRVGSRCETGSALHSFIKRRSERRSERRLATVGLTQIEAPFGRTNRRLDVTRVEGHHSLNVTRAGEN